MTMSRRLALGCASAFALSGGLTGSSLASVVKGAASALSGGRNLRAAQRFEELLIHRDEAGHVPHSAMIWVAAPDAAWYAVDTLDDLTYRMMNRQNKKHGYRLRRVSAFKTKQGVRYAACWEQIPGPDWHSRHGMSRPEFEAACADFMRRGFRMAHVDARVNYAAIWEKGDAASQQTFAALTLAEYEQQLATLTAQGLRPTRVSATAATGAPSVAAIFEKDAGVAWREYHQLNVADFHKTTVAMKAQGYRLMDASGYMLAGKPSFSGIWEKA